MFLIFGSRFYIKAYKYCLTSKNKAMINLVATVLLISQKMAIVNSACQFITSTDAGCDDDICIETWKDGFCQGIIFKITILLEVSQSFNSFCILFIF